MDLMRACMWPVVPYKVSALRRDYGSRRSQKAAANAAARHELHEGVVLGRNRAGLHLPSLQHKSQSSQRLGPWQQMAPGLQSHGTWPPLSALRSQPKGDAVPQRKMKRVHASPVRTLSVTSTRPLRSLA
eukprot:scaffold1903_cov396-Prasinococcus_capsulatus_cf.AAC.26